MNKTKTQKLQDLKKRITNPEIKKSIQEKINTKDKIVRKDDTNTRVSD